MDDAHATAASRHAADGSTRPLRVALLGCGVVGSRGGPAADDAGRRPRRARRRARSSWPASPCAGRAATARPGVDPALLTTDADGAGRPATTSTSSSRSSAASSPPASLILAAMERGASVVTANKALLAEDGATLYAAADEARRRPLLRGRRRRRDPAAAPAARVAGRRPRPPGARHRQRHHQLHPHPDGRDRRRLRRRRSTRRRRSATPRPTRPPTSRASTPRPRRRSSPPRVPHPGHRRRRPPRGHHRGHRAPTSPAPGRWAAWSSCWRSASSSADGRSVGVRVHPAMIPRTHPLAGVREAFNAVFVEAEAAGRADVLRPRRRRRADRERGARRPRRRRPPPGRRRPRPGGVGVRRPAGAPDGRDGHALPRQPRRRRPARRARRGREVFAEHERLDPRPCARRGTATTTRRWSSSPTAPPTPRWRRRSRSCAQLDVVRARSPA